MTKAAYARITELDQDVQAVAEASLLPRHLILALKVGLAIATALNELTSAVDDVVRATRSR